MASHITTRISCPLQGFEGCRSGNGKGFTKKYFIDHFGTRHFKTDALKASHKARVASDFSLFSAFDQALRQEGIWLCGECFCTHTFSKNCKHVDGDVVLAPSFDEFAIYGIPVPLRPVLNVVDGVAVESASTLDTDKAVVEGVASVLPSLGIEPTCFDIDLLSSVFSKKLRTVKCIPPRLRLGFAKIFRSALDKVIACPGDLSVWVQLLILPCCVLTTLMPTNRAQRRSGERERCQFESISRAILRWRDPADRKQECVNFIVGQEDLDLLAARLQQLGHTIVSTGGTTSALEKAGISVTEVEELTNFLEMLDGRVKHYIPMYIAAFSPEEPKAITWKL
ncbi:hypothetical protein CTI12_AA093400 [Artemisia annua]|uniref:MGS-like domain-containing protein n=1 Tax=Artemisia annua TaxID=35608 RepID=A0A2U1Q090_ARTAN|nr:hypothetical protein CTI12_AA093400 [Artemisia annua]